MDKVKEKLHLRRKSKPENDTSAHHQHGASGEEHRASVDSELEAMSPQERVAYMKEFEEAERTGEPKKGSLIDKLIARGNKRTEDQLAKEHSDRQAQLGNTAAPAPGGGVVR